MSYSVILRSMDTNTREAPPEGITAAIVKPQKTPVSIAAPNRPFRALPSVFKVGPIDVCAGAFELVIVEASLALVEVDEVEVAVFEVALEPAPAATESDG
jgi:hypothetical protein